LNQIQAADDQVRHALVEVQTRTLALDAYDRRAFALGLKLLFLPPLLLVALIILCLVL
jgi:hypothetical protein